MNNLFFGTWELDGILKPVSDKKARDLLLYAKSHNINKFDTALAYGAGKVERILSEVINDDDIILTKVPAITKPTIDECFVDDYYPAGYVKKMVNTSMKNLSRDFIDIVLLHNLSRNWDGNVNCIKELLELKDAKKIRYIGISLPNNFNLRLSEDIIRNIDYIEAPLNKDNRWILNDIDFYHNKGLKIVLRSLFLQGEVLKNGEFSVDEILLNVIKYNTFITVGMTDFSQIDENVKILEVGRNE